MTEPAQAIPARALRARHRAESLSARLPPLLLAADRVANTVAQGVHGRRRVGTGETFWQFRRYSPGDSAHRIDWRQSAKGTGVFIRETEWEAAQTAYLWRDASASMDWRSDEAADTKQARAELLVLAAATLMVRAGERFSLMGSGRPPAANTNALATAALDLTRRSDRADTSDLPPQQSLPRHCACLLLSDFLGPIDALQARLVQLLRAGVRGCLMQVLDPAEEELPYDGRIAFDGLEGEERLLVPRVETLRAAYREKLAARRATLDEICRSVGWSFLIHRTDRPPQAALLAIWGALAREAV